MPSLPKTIDAQKQLKRAYLNATQPAALAICLPHLVEESEWMLAQAESGREAIEWLRLMRFELVVASMNVPDVYIWDLLKSIRGCWPWQKLALAAEQISPQDEIRARQLGVVGIFEPAAVDAELSRLIGHIARNSLKMARDFNARSAAGSRKRRPPRGAAPQDPQPTQTYQDVGRMEGVDDS